jgi:hypothetical protein
MIPFFQLTEEMALGGRYYEMIDIHVVGSSVDSEEMKQNGIVI